MNGYVSLGLPASGKTTYLAALWHVLESREVPGALRQRGLQADREYLNEIRDAWFSFSPVPRTETPVGSVVFDLEDDAGKVKGQIHFPDLPGESFRAQWTDRYWSEDFDSKAREARGFLLFGTPDFHQPVLIQEVNRRIPGATGGERLRPEVQWTAAKAPTQAQLVELLQFLAEARTPGPPTPLAIVISAWDRTIRFAALEGAPTPSPEDWVREHMPLLWQYVVANPELFHARWYGISAQGGDLEDPSDVERLQGYTLTSERIRVVEEGEETIDPTRPLRWLLEQSGSAP